MTTILNQELILLIEIIIGVLILYTISYIKKKAENSAQKEDIHEISKIIEGVKLLNQKEIEGIKGDISILTNRRSQIFNEEKLAILEFNTAINDWLFVKTNIRLSEFNHSNVHELKDKIRDLRDAHNSANLSFSKVQILVDNTELVMLGSEIISQMFKLHQFMESLSLRLESTLITEKGLIEAFFKMDPNERRTDLEMMSFFREMGKDSSNEKDAIIEELYKEKLELYKASMDLKVQFQEMAKQHLLI